MWSPTTSAAVDLATRVIEGDRKALPRLLSALENRQTPDVDKAMALLYRNQGHAHSIGITGAPGAGKSTTTNRLIAAFRGRGETVGVLAVDPSSVRTGGALLGDRIRMMEHGLDDGVFIRSLANRGHLGGLALVLPHAIRALNASGLDWIVVETVGVGQAEIEVAHFADTTLVLLTPQGGDRVQASKAGLLEFADVVAVNKADLPGAKDTVRDLRAELFLLEKNETRWTPLIVSCSAANGDGVDAVIDAVEKHRAHLASTNHSQRRRERLEAEIKMTMHDIIVRKLESELASGTFDAVVDRVVDRDLDPTGAAKGLVDAWTEPLRGG